MLQIEFCQNCEVILDILPYEHPTGVLFFGGKNDLSSIQYTQQQLVIKVKKNYTF